jgi:hypothetical protein
MLVLRMALMLVYSNNLLDHPLTMIKNFAYPFDYRGMGRQIMFDVKFTY